MIEKVTGLMSHITKKVVIIGVIALIAIIAIIFFVGNQIQTAKEVSEFEALDKEKAILDTEEAELSRTRSEDELRSKLTLSEVNKQTGLKLDIPGAAENKFFSVGGEETWGFDEQKYDDQGNPTGDPQQILTHSLKAQIEFSAAIDGEDQIFEFFAQKTPELENISGEAISIGPDTRVEMTQLGVMNGNAVDVKITIIPSNGLAIANWYSDGVSYSLKTTFQGNSLAPTDGGYGSQLAYNFMKNQVASIMALN